MAGSIIAVLGFMSLSLLSSPSTFTVVSERVQPFQNDLGTLNTTWTACFWFGHEKLGWAVVTRGLGVFSLLAAVPTFWTGA